MRPKFLRQFSGKDPVTFMIVALLCAAGLVIYLQQRALRALDRQTALIVQKIAEQTTSEVLASIRRTFDGPVFDTLASIKHPHLVEHRLDLVAPAFERGLGEYPQVERFFVWTGADSAGQPREVLFYERSRTKAGGGGKPDLDSRFSSDRATGDIIRSTARQHARSQKIYGAFQAPGADGESDIFLRIFYTDAARTQFFAVLGFVVNHDAVRQDLFPALVAQGLDGILESSGGGPTFELRVHDEHGRLVYGSEDSLPAVSVERPLPLVFYPEEDILPRMAASLPSRDWKLTLTQQSASTPSLIAFTRWQSYGLSGLSVLLICVALGFALQARARALQLSRMQSDFVAHVSHQLKTPVSLLSAVSETLDVVRARSPEKLEQCLDIVKMETTRLSLLVQHILEFSSLSDGARRFETEPVSLGPLVRETVESFAAALAPTGFRIEVHEHAAPVVAADPVALEQAVVNLLDNAIKYSGLSRAVTVRLTADASHAVIEIIDRGIGIAPDDQARIFERFYRVDGGFSNSRQGFGLGLAIARQLVAGQHGSIELESILGVGSTFRIRLPLLRGPQESPARVESRRWFSRRPIGAAVPAHVERETS
jgi:signal transduction histidine kinase